MVGLSWLAVILRIDAFISPFGTGLIYQTSTSRVGYGLARNRYYPQLFAKTDKRGVPWFSLIIAFLFGLLFLLPFPSWNSLVGLVTSASVLMYAGAPLSLGAFRKQVPEAARPYRMPGAVVLAPLALHPRQHAHLLVGLRDGLEAGRLIVVGYVLIGIFMAFDKQRPPLDWKSAQWLPVYLIGMGIISWQGQFTAAPGTSIRCRHNTGNIPFWWDMVIVAGFSLIIYFWAQATKLPREEMLDLVNRQAANPSRSPSGTDAGRRSRTRPAGPVPTRGRGQRALAAAQGPVADQDPALDQRGRHRTEPPAVHRPGGRVRRLQPPAAVLAARRALHDQHRRAPGMAGQHDLACADPPGPADQQPVTGPEHRLHGTFGDGDPQQRRVHGASSVGQTGRGSVGSDTSDQTLRKVDR